MRPTLIVIDYSSVYYPQIARTAILRRRGGKFVQIIKSDADQEYLVLSPGELSPYHSDIVERFGLHQGVEGAYSSLTGRFEIHQDEYSVLGGGEWVVDDERRELRLFGKSMAYGAFESAGLAEGLGSGGMFRGYAIAVDLGC